MFNKDSIKKGFGYRGFTLIELLSVMAILMILAAIATVSVTSSIEKAEREVCFANVQQLERNYEAYLAMEDVVHSDIGFSQYLQRYEGDICPSGGEISYVDGTVRCSLHPSGEGWEKEDDADGGIPFL